MLTFGDIKDESRKLVKDPSSKCTDQQLIRLSSLLSKDLMIRTNGEYLYDEHTFSSTASLAEYSLPSRFLKMIILYDTTNEKEVSKGTRDDERFFDVDRTDTGTPDVYYHTYLRDVQYQPSSASQITVVSNHADDTSANGHFFRLRGLDSNDIEISETLNMNGTTPVISSETYKEIWECSKGGSGTSSAVYSSNGIYTVTSNAGVVTNLKLGKDDIRKQFQWIRFIDSPDSVINYRSHFIRKPKLIRNDYDTFDAPEFYENAILLGMQWYIKWFLYDKRDAEVFTLYEREVERVRRFLEKDENDRFIHKEIDLSMSSGLYQPPVGHISRRA